MTDAELQYLRGVLALQRHALVRTLCAAAADEQRLEPAFVILLANVHTAIMAVDAVLAESVTAGETPWEKHHEG